MAELAGKVESKVSERVDKTRDTVKREVGIVKTFISEMVGLRPVKATVDVVVDTMDNIGDFLKAQADITRRWIG